MSAVRPFGGGGAAQQVQVHQVQSWYNTSRGATPSSKRRDEYLGYLDRFLVTALFLENRLTALLGVRDVIVVQAGGATLVCARDRAQDIKKVVEQLRTRGGYESLL